MTLKAGDGRDAETLQKHVLEIEPVKTVSNTEDEASSIRNSTPRGTINVNGSQARHSPLFIPQDSPVRPSSTMHDATYLDNAPSSNISIHVPPVERRWEYQTYKEAPVLKVLEEYDDGGDIQYLVKLRDGCERRVSDFSFGHEYLIRTP